MKFSVVPLLALLLVANAFAGWIAAQGIAGSVGGLAGMTEEEVMPTTTADAGST